MFDYHRVRVSRNYGTVMVPGWHYPLRGPLMHRIIQPHALEWLDQRAGKRAKTRAAFDCHDKFRWWFHLPQPQMDNTQECNWQQRKITREHLEQAEFLFKDVNVAVLFRLSFS